MNKPIFTVSAKALVATHLFRCRDEPLKGFDSSVLL